MKMDTFLPTYTFIVKLISFAQFKPKEIKVWRGNNTEEVRDLPHFTFFCTDLALQRSNWDKKRKKGVGGCVRGWKAVQGRREERWTKMGRGKLGGAVRGRSHMRVLHCSISSVSKSLHLPLFFRLSTGLLSQQEPMSNSFPCFISECLQLPLPKTHVWQ